MSEPLIAMGDDAERTRLLAGYRPRPGHYDELVDARGQIRPHWRAYIDRLAASDRTEREQAYRSAERTLTENGLSYVAQDVAEETLRPWQLDLLPVLIAAEEWRALETALIQRAQLLNAVTEDLYGPQRLIAEGHLPAALVHSNPYFCRPCYGIAAPGGTWLHLLAFDLVRGHDGHWLVVGDRSEAPSGSGYALENRIAVSRALPKLFADMNVERLAGFFRGFSENFLSLSRHEEPLVVVLSTATQRESYFEHAYLAQYLGYNVVEGSDLTIRGDRLYLKSVEGLKPVDLMVRQAESSAMDPLELSTFGFGVPGLLRAVRGGHVALANAIGSGLVQSEALLSYMPKLAEVLLGESLALESVPTWWCGSEAGRRSVLENLDGLAVRDLTKSRAILGGVDDAYAMTEAGTKERAALERAIAIRPHDFVGRALPAASTAPRWTEAGGLEAVPMTLRVYLAATAGGYRAMPGGLARVRPEGAASLPISHESDITKDAWVLSEGPVEAVSMLPTVREVVALRRSGRELPSRTADNLFWFGRYLERLEGAVRLLRSFVLRIAGAQRAGSDLVTPGRVMELLEALQHVSPEGAERFRLGGASVFLRDPALFFADPDCPDDLVSLLGDLSRLSTALRERFSRDTWDHLQKLLGTPLAQVKLPGYGQAWLQRLLQELVDHLSALNGMMMENMTRDFGWHFLDIGRRLERGWQTTRALSAVAGEGEAEREGGLELLLELADSLMTYSWRYKSEAQLAPLLDLLLLEENNPRSVIYQVSWVADHLRALPQSSRASERLSVGEQQTIRLSARLRLADVFLLAKEPETALAELLAETTMGLEAISDELTETYFNHALETRVSGVGPL